MQGVVGKTVKAQEAWYQEGLSEACECLACIRVETFAADVRRDQIPSSLTVAPHRQTAESV